MFVRFATKIPFKGNGFYDVKVKLRPKRQKRCSTLSFSAQRQIVNKFG